MRAEDRRQGVHAAMTLLALLLRGLTPTQAALVAGAAVVLNWVVLPLTGLDRGLRREGGPWIDGVKTYPVAVLAAVLLFPLPVAAAAWAVLGIGDAASNVVGRRIGKPPFLGRADRSMAGTLAFVATAAPAALLVHAFVAGAAPGTGTLVAACGAAAAGAVVELLTPRFLDDNLPICLAAGAAFWALA